MTMRTQEEMNEAITFWAKARDDAAADPKYNMSPAHVLFKGVVWALQWANGRPREDIFNEAMKEKWIMDALELR